MSHVDASHRPLGFESTRWSLVAAARSGDTPARRAALEQLLKIYYPALRAHLMARMHVDETRADDLLQSFVMRKVLERDLMARANPNKGRLRSLLLKSLENFARSEFVRDRRAPQSLDADSSAAPLPTPPAGADAFDVAWARSVLIEALCRMWAECQRMGRKHIWAILEARVIRPALGQPPVPYEELVAQFHLPTPHEASNALITAKRQFQRTLRGVVAESVGSEEEIDSEIADMGRILAAAPADRASDFARSVVPAADSQTGPILLAIDETPPGVLAQLMALPADRETLWNDADLAGLVRHQLSVPLNLVFASLGNGRGRSSALLPSFGALLTSRYASLEVLDTVKRAARKTADDESSVVPRQIGVLLYFASIALALVRHDERITKTDDAELRRWFRKMLEQPWLSKALRQLFVEGIRKLETASVKSTR